MYYPGRSFNRRSVGKISCETSQIFCHVCAGIPDGLADGNKCFTPFCLHSSLFCGFRRVLASFWVTGMARLDVSMFVFRGTHRTFLAHSIGTAAFVEVENFEVQRGGFVTKGCD